MSQPRLALITFVDAGGPVDPGYGRPGYGGGYPDQGLPGFPGRPDNSLPGYGRPDNSLPGGGYPSHGLPGLPPFVVQLPVFPWDPTDPGYGKPEGGRPDNSLPGSGGRPDQGLPRPGMKYVVKWLACHGLILVPDNDLPGSGGRPDNELPEAPEPK